ncbi:hypothetical protein BH09MYX1_BH09MYX1_44620 [soil metagenome]
MALRRAAVVIAAALVMIAAACASTPTSVTVVSPPRAEFPAVAQALVHGCGTLDCHGSAFRNLRIYGNEGLRLDPSHRPLSPRCTATEEVNEDFAALTGLEPTIMSAVTTSGGATPDALLFVRKARGSEHHKAGAVVVVGDDLDVCLTSWLTGTTDVDACRRAAPPTYPITMPAFCDTGP